MKSKNQKNTSSGFFSVGEDFIPFASHISNQTIITKNIQLLQTIKINNFNHKELNEENPTKTLRELIRIAIQKNITSTDFAFWIHTIRRKTDLTKFYNSSEPHSKGIFESWSKYYKLDEQFVNELYITIISKGPQIQDKEIATKYFTHKKLKNFVFTELEEFEKSLSTATDGMMADLKYYNPTKLSIVEEDGVMYSQNIEFFHKIFNLVDLKSQVQESDIANLLTISQVELLENSINIKNEFASHSLSTLVLKHYLETDLEVLDRVLSLPFEFIIYQAFDFINTDEVLSKYYLQYKMLKVSKDVAFMEQLNLTDEEFKDVEESKGKVTLNYGESQIGFIIIADNQELLQTETSQLVSILQDTGFVFIRDDVEVENTFYSSIPSNFAFLRRMQPLQTSRIGGFASIDNYPSGKSANNLWGECVTIFKSIDGASYFFNFHCDEKGGHTLSIGVQNSIFQYALINFLIANSLKLGVRVLNLDFNESSKLFTTFIGGDYKTISLKKNESSLKINPSSFLCDENTLYELATLCLQISNKNTENNIKYLKEKLIPFVKSHKSKINNLQDFLDLIKSEKVISIFFKPLTDKGAFSHAFSKEDDILNLKAGEVLSVDVTSALEGNENQMFIFNYLLMQIKSLIKDKQKTIIKIDFFLSLCFNTGMEKSKIIELLKYFTKHNAVLIMQEDYGLFDDYTYDENADTEIMNLISNQIYIPAFIENVTQEFAVPFNYIKNVSRMTKLSNKEEQKIKDYSHNNSVFLLKHAGKLIGLEFNESFSPLLFFFLSNMAIKSYFLETIKSAPNFERKMQEAKSIYKILFKENEDK